MELYLSLGSNLGDRQSNIEMALSMLDSAFGTSYSRLSDMHESESWGFEGPVFLDCAVCYEINDHGHRFSPQEVLSICKEIERILGRTDAPEFDSDGKRIYHDRTMDIDILFFGLESIESESLTIPHRLISKRDFVKIPLRQIASEQIRDTFGTLFQ